MPMAGMKRFVTYIYSYENKKKGSNTGFAKIEIRGEDCRIEIHLRGVYIGKTILKVFLFRENAGDMEGFPLGEMKIQNGNGNFVSAMKVGRIGNTPFGMYEMEGLFLLGEEDEILMSRWKEGKPLEVTKERFRVWEAPESRKEKKIMPQEQQMKENRYREVSQGAARQSEEDPLEKRVPTVSEEARQGRSGLGAERSQLKDETTPTGAEQILKKSEPKATEKTASEEELENIAATEIPMRNIFPKYDWPEIWENLSKEHQLYRPFAEKRIVCARIELKDLRELPKRYWYLGNNSFLLHGFFNYHYLMIGNMADKRWFIGIPGIYQQQERVMAAIFGFPEFLPVSLNENEKKADSDADRNTFCMEAEHGEEPLNRFGFWYRFIE